LRESQKEKVAFLYSINPEKQALTTLPKLERDDLVLGCWQLASGF